MAGFLKRIEERLDGGGEILDLGAGRSPTLDPQLRRECHYVGMDQSPTELGMAPDDAYDETVVADACRFVPEMAGRFDLVITWNMLEHVPSLERALENAYSYLRPGGRLVAHFPSGMSVFALLNRVVPHRLGGRLMESLLDRARDTKFEAYYDRCYYAAFRPLLEPFTDWGVVLHFRAGIYFGFSPALQAGYIAWEEWAMQSGRPNLATHYTLYADR